MLRMTGAQVSVTTNDGNSYDGIFNTYESQEILDSIKLRRVRSVGSTVTLGSMTFSFKNLDSFSTCAMPISLEKADKSFKTDTGISNAGPVKERVLQKWTPDASVPAVGLSTASGHYDQFAVNEKLFGVTTDFVEDDYTTVIDRSDPNFAKKESMAARVAKEMESSGPSTEERNRAAFGELDEEDQYSSVIRLDPKKERGWSQDKRPDSSSEPRSQDVRRQDSRKPELKSQDARKTESNVDSKTGSKGAWGSESAERAAVHSSPVASTVKNAWAKPLEFPKLESPLAATALPPKPVKPVSRATPTAPLPSKPVPKTKEESPKVSPATFANIVEKNAAGSSSKEPHSTSGQKTEELVNAFKAFSVDEKNHIRQRKEAIDKMKKDGVISDFKAFSNNLKIPEFSPGSAEPKPPLSKPVEKSAVQPKPSQEKPNEKSNGKHQEKHQEKSQENSHEKHQEKHQEKSQEKPQEKPKSGKESTANKLEQQELKPTERTRSKSPPKSSQREGESSRVSNSPAPPADDQQSEAGTESTVTSSFKFNAAASEFTPGLGFAPASSSSSRDTRKKPYKNQKMSPNQGQYPPYEEQQFAYSPEYGQYYGYNQAPVNYGYRPQMSARPMAYPTGQPNPYMYQPQYPPQGPQGYMQQSGRPMYPQGMYPPPHQEMMYPMMAPGPGWVEPPPEEFVQDPDVPNPQE